VRCLLTSVSPSVVRPVIISRKRYITGPYWTLAGSPTTRMRRYRLPPHSATHNLESEPQFWNSDVAYFLVLVLLSVRLYHHTTVVVNRVRPSQSVDNIHRPLRRHGCETASYRRDDIPIITSHDCESWYWFHRVCMSVCVCVCLRVCMCLCRQSENCFWRHVLRFAPT